MRRRMASLLCVLCILLVCSFAWHCRKTKQSKQNNRHIAHAVCPAKGSLPLDLVIRGRRYRHQRRQRQLRRGALNRSKIRWLCTSASEWDKKQKLHYNILHTNQKNGNEALCSLARQTTENLKLPLMQPIKGRRVNNNNNNNNYNQRVPSRIRGIANIIEGSKIILFSYAVVVVLLLLHLFFLHFSHIELSHRRQKQNNSNKKVVKGVAQQYLMSVYYTPAHISRTQHHFYEMNHVFN